MSDKNAARRARAEINFGGTDITSSILPYFLSLTYTDSEEDEADDLSLRLADRDDIWLSKWLGGVVDADGTAPDTITGLKISAAIVALNFSGDGADKALDCGQFELDSVSASGPPGVIDIRATGLPYSSGIRQTEKSRAWEAYTLSGIAGEMAAAAGMTCMYLPATDPFYARVEQYKTPDMSLLSRLCHNAGISLKATGNIIVLFDQKEYEGKPVSFIVKRKDRSYIKWRLLTGETATKYASCRVSYVDPATGRSIEATAYVKDYAEIKERQISREKSDLKKGVETEKNELQQLEITAKVTSVAEAKTLAEKNLRLYNKHEKTASLTFPGNPDLVAGITIELEDFECGAASISSKKPFTASETAAIPRK